MAAAAEYFTADVVSATRVSPYFVRLVLGGPGLAGFETTGIPDEWVRIFLPPAGEHRLDPPVPSGAGWDWQGEAPEGRYYTVRAWDAARAEMVVDVVVHDHGLLTGWSQGDCVGDQVVLCAPRGSFTLPADARWLWLVGDLTAYPALCRIAEQLPAGLPVRMDVEVPDHDTAYSLTRPTRLSSGAELEVSWVVNPPTRDSASGLEGHVRATTWPEGDGYFWMAGEAAQMRGLRKYLRHELRLPTTAYDVMGYWRVDAERWQALYEASDVDALRIWTEGEQAGKDEADIWDEYEAALTRAGL